MVASFHFPTRTDDLHHQNGSQVISTFAEMHDVELSLIPVLNQLEAQIQDYLGRLAIGQSILVLVEIGWTLIADLST